MVWEFVTDTAGTWTYRLKVDGGYIYSDNDRLGGLAMCFVPDVDLQRYQSHLRDAYNQGFRDGQDFQYKDLLGHSQSVSKTDTEC